MTFLRGQKVAKDYKIDAANRVINWMEERKPEVYKEIV